MSNLKDQLIKLGSKRPELRNHIRPVLAELDKTAVKANTFYVMAYTGKISLEGVLDSAAESAFYLKRVSDEVQDEMSNIVTYIGEALDARGYGSFSPTVMGGDRMSLEIRAKGDVDLKRRSYSEKKITDLVEEAVKRKGRYFSTNDIKFRKLDL